MPEKAAEKVEEDKVPLPTPSARSYPEHKRAKPSGRSTVSAGAAAGAGVIVTLYGIYGFFRTVRFYGEGDPLNGIVGNAFSVAAVVCGLMCFQSFRTRYGKYAKYVLILGLLISFGIPLLLLFL